MTNVPKDTPRGHINNIRTPLALDLEHAIAHNRGYILLSADEVRQMLERLKLLESWARGMVTEPIEPGGAL